MRLLLTAFGLGALAFAALALLGCVALAALADASGRASFELAIGSVVFLEFVREGTSTSTTFGPGVAAAAVFGGALNAGGAALLRGLGRRRA
jgi:hypothetical protein